MPEMHRPKLYKAARTMNDLETLASGNPKRILRRGKRRRASLLAIVGGGPRRLNMASILNHKAATVHNIELAEKLF